MTSLAHMTKMATEARSEGVERWIVDHVESRRRYEGQKLRKKLCHERKALAGCHYQPLSGCAATGDYFCNEVYKLPSEWRWRCRRGEKQFRHHLFVNCTACELQIRHMWNDLGGYFGWGEVGEGLVPLDCALRSFYFVHMVGNALCQ